MPFPASAPTELPAGAARAGAEDLALARRVASGDEAAFALLMRRHNRLLYRAARSILKTEAEVEDAVQDAYLSAFRTIGQFRGDARLSTWMVRIVMNEAFSRSRTRTRSLVLAGRLEGDAGASAWRPELPEESVERSHARDLLQSRIDALPEPLRSVFVLRAIEELSVDEVAEALHIPRALVAVRYFRARHRLRAALREKMPAALASLLPFAGRRCDAMVAATLARLRRSGALRLA